MADQETWLTVGEAHRRLAEMNISEQTVRDWADAGKLKARRLLSGHRRIAASSIDAMLADYRGAPDA